MLAQERLELMDHGYKSDEIDQCQATLEDEARESVIFAEFGQCFSHGAETHAGHIVGGAIRATNQLSRHSIASGPIACRKREQSEIHRGVN